MTARRKTFLVAILALLLLRVAVRAARPGRYTVVAGLSRARACFAGAYAGSGG